MTYHPYDGWHYRRDGTAYYVENGKVRRALKDNCTVPAGVFCVLTVGEQAKYGCAYVNCSGENAKTFYNGLMKGTRAIM